MRFSFLSVCFFLIGTTLQTTGQDRFCGTRVPVEKVLEEQQQLASGAKSPMPDICLDRTVSCSVHVIGLGTWSIFLENSYKSMIENIVQQEFEPICLKFEVCSFEYLDVPKYTELTMLGGEGPELEEQFNIPNTMNIYIVFEMAEENIGGFTYLPGGPDIIVVESIVQWSSRVMTHLVGHYFGLYDTDEILFGNELVDGSNCTTTGDLICDTPAEPATGRLVEPSLGFFQCKFDYDASPDIKDSIGEYYVPMIGNYMSDFAGYCGCEFTRGQYERMADQFINFRNYLR